LQKAKVYILSVQDFPAREEGEKLLSSLPALLQHEIDRYKTPGDFHRSLLSKLVLQKALGEIGLHHEFSQIQKSEFGKYFIPGNIDFSISHTADKVIVALAENVKIGVDVELKSKGSLLLAERFFCEEEVEWLKTQNDLQEAFTYIWTRKEALVKAAGTGIRMPLKSFNVLPESIDFIDGKWFLQSDLQKNTSDVLTLATSAKTDFEILEISSLSVI